MTSSPGEINGNISVGSTSGTCVGYFDKDDTVTLTATPDSSSSSTFEGWSGACSGSECEELELEVDMDINRTVTAIFFQCTDFGTVIHKPEIDYEIEIWDHVHVCHGGHSTDITRVVWELFGDVGTPSTCDGSVAECAQNPQYVPGCDEDAHFYVTYYEDQTVVSEYGFAAHEITYENWRDPCGSL